MSRRALLLAIDAGTTGARAIAFDTGGEVRGAAYEELTVVCPRPGWVETDPLALWQAVRRVVDAALRQAGATSASVAAVGIANQRATTLLWERRTSRPLHAAIVWQDVRTAPRVADLQQRGVFASTMTSSTKLEWLLQHVEQGPQRAARGDLCFGTVDSWIVWKLTAGAAHVTDASNASCTGLYDYASGKWDTAALDLLAIPEALLPEIVASSGVVGESDEEACGFSAPVAALTGDQQASMFGLQRHRRGDIKITFGTSAMVDVNTADFPILSRRGAYPLVLWQLPGARSFCLEGTAITAGAAVQWLRDGLGLIGSAEESAVLAASVENTGGVWVVPALQGLGTPHMDPTARAVIGGLSRASTKAHVVRATLEGISFRCREIVEALSADIGESRPQGLRVDGGAAENDFLLQHLADSLGTTVERPATVQGTALGAALLAGLGAGIWSDVAEIGQVWRTGTIFEPTWDGARRDEEFARWRSALPAARSLESH